MEIKKITDPAFSKYGKVIDFVCTKELQAEMMKTPSPDEVVYVPSVAELEALPVYKELSEQVYGGMPIQIGYCNGYNHTLNAVEYHRDSEINIACGADAILLIGAQQDVDTKTFEYDTAKMEAFLLPAGTAAEVYATTLHYAPISVGEEHFRVVVVLPKGTNEALNFTPAKEGEPKLMTAINKWLIAHPEAGIEGAFCGLKGENITI